MFKKMVSGFLAASLVMGSLAGCRVSTDTGEAVNSNKSQSEASSDGGKATGDEEQITWMFWDNLEATEDLITKGYKDVIDRYNETYKGKYYCNVVTTNLEEYDTKLNALVASGNTPDVFICNPGPNLTQYVDAGVAADLTDLLKKDDTDWYNTFTEGIFERITYDGKIMAIPTNFAAACVFYNTDIFKESGALVPNTYEELIEVCKKIKEAGYTPISCSAGTAWCLSMIAGYLCDREGGPDNLAQVNEGTLDWTSKSFLNAGYKLQELSQYFQDSAAGDSNDQATANFYSGNAAMLVQGSWAIAQINGNNPEFESKCGVFQFPKIEGGSDPNRMIVKTDNLVMSANTKNKDACMALMKMFTDETAQKYTAEVAGKIPVTNVEIDYGKAPEQFAYIGDILKNVTGTLGFYNESLTSVEAGDTFDDAMVDIFLGNTTPEDALEKVQDYFEKNVWNQ